MVFSPVLRALALLCLLVFSPLSGFMDTLLEKLSLSVEEDDELEIVYGDSSLATPGLMEFCLVGHFLTELSINFNLMKSRMASIWRIKKGLFVKDIGAGRYDGYSWFFGNHLLILCRLDVGDHPLQVPLDKINFWVQIYDLPLMYFSEQIRIQLGNFLGFFVEYDELNKSLNWRSFMRIRVSLDVSKPLKRWKRIKKGDGSVFVVSFRIQTYVLSSPPERNGCVMIWEVKSSDYASHPHPSQTGGTEWVTMPSVDNSKGFLSEFWVVSNLTYDVGHMHAGKEVSCFTLTESMKHKLAGESFGSSKEAQNLIEAGSLEGVCLGPREF
ncbi:hypothetical protein ACS0TY_017906 [Phlomoides rotata]